MNARERLLTTLRGERADRVPLKLAGFAFDNEEKLEAHPDPGRREIARRIFPHTVQHVGCKSYVNRWLVTPPQRIREVSREKQGDEETIVEEFDTPKGVLTAVSKRNSVSDTTWIVKYPVESLSDIEKMRSIPWERPLKLASPDLSDPPADFEERFLVASAVSSPFVCVAGMMPYQYFLELCATELPLMKELTELCLERILDVLDVILVDKNIEYMWMGGCEWLTPPMASAAVYETLVQEPETRIISRMHEAGALCHVHCHGNVRSTLESVIERGADFFEPVEPPPDGDITFAEAKAVAAGRITLGGNVEDRLIAGNDTDAVDRAVRAAFEGGKERMVLQTTAGPICKLTPDMLRNYHRLIDVWEELSSLDS